MARLAGDLSLAEDCAQEACAAAVKQWPRDGVPSNPGGWVVAVARRRALDQLRRERARAGKEREAAQEWAAAGPDGCTVAGDDQLALLFACCHPALDPASRVPLTLRVVCGLPAASIAQLLLLSEPAVAQRIVRAKRKIRDAGIRLRVPDLGERPARLAPVLRVIYLTFTEGHSPHGTGAVVRDDLCEEALRLASRLHGLLPDEPEVTGLLALILLTSARSAARADEDGALVPLTDQDRSRWDRGRLDVGQSLIETALAQRRPGPYQLQAAIAACHADAATAADTDWRQIAALYGELLRFDPSPVIAANRAVAVAYAEGPAAGLAILDTLAVSSRLSRWPQLHIARGALLAQCGRHEDAAAAYRGALALEPAGPVRQHITGQIAALSAAHAPTEETLMDVDAALQSQIRNIEATYGKPLDHWFAVIDSSGLTKHTEVVAMLKADHGLAHGAAHRVSLLARQRASAGAPAPADPADALYAGAKAGLRPLHDALLGEIRALGAFDIAPKKGYLSLRRRKQFAMVQPSTTSRIDLGLILPATTAAAGRLEPAAKFNPLFTHRVRITAATDLNDELRGWLAAAYALAG